VILNSNPGIVSVEELDHQQRYQANISPLQFPGNSLNMLDGGLVSISIMNIISKALNSYKFIIIYFYHLIIISSSP
jgi:hypothetical protein